MKNLNYIFLLIIILLQSCNNNTEQPVQSNYNGDIKSIKYYQSGGCTPYPYIGIEVTPNNVAYHEEKMTDQFTLITKDTAYSITIDQWYDVINSFDYNEFLQLDKSYSYPDDSINKPIDISTYTIEITTNDTIKKVSFETTKNVVSIKNLSIKLQSLLVNFNLVW